MNLGKNLLVSCTGLLLCACSAVFVTEPIGENALALEDSWSGTWLVEGDVIQTAVLDGGKGLLKAAWIERGDKGFEFKQHPVHVRYSGENRFVSVLDEEDGQGYVWALVRQDSANKILLWSPDPERFAELVGEGVIPGSMQEPDNPDNGNVVLGELEAEHIERIVDPASGLLDWQNPLVMVRILD